MAMRRTIETRFLELCAFFDVEQTLARGLTRFAVENGANCTDL